MKADIPIKRVLQVKPQDWASFVLPNIQIADIKEVNTVLVPKSQSLVDGLQMINDDFYLHIEANGYLDKAMPARMLRYRADIWEDTMSKGMGTPSIKQVLLLFYEKQDNKKHELHDAWDNETTLQYGYRVIKIWEIPKETVVSKKLVGLYPLLPLMKHGEDKTPEQILESAVETAFTVEDRTLRADLLSAMALLAEEKFTKKVIVNYIRREHLMRSAVFEDYARDYAEEYAKQAIEEAEARAIEKGITKGKLEAALEVAKKLFTLGLSTPKIAELTGLSIDKVQELTNNQND